MMPGEITSPPPSRLGLLCIVSGPTSSGKTTVCRAVCRQTERWYSVSCTTRPPREGEEHGREYFFLEPEEFDDLVSRGAFLEHASVHGRRYGTLRSTVCERLLAGTDVLMDLDIQGAAQLRVHPDPVIRAAFVDVFMVPKSFQEIKSRLQGRGTEQVDGPEYQLRLRNALIEVAHWREYRYLLTSRTREEDATCLRNILEAEALRTNLHPAGQWPDAKADPQTND